MERKKILCITDSLASGGAQRQLIGLSDLLQEKGYDVVLAHYYPDNFYKEWLDKHNIRVVYEKCGDGKLSKLLEIRRLIRAISPEVIIAYIDGPTVICSILKFLGMKFKLIVSERNVTQNLSRGEKIKFFMYRFADYIVANSKTQENFINKNFSNLSPKTYCITNFVDTRFFKPLEEKNVINDKLQVLVVGRINSQKNVIRFLQVVKVLKEKNERIFFDWYGDYDTRAHGEQYFQEVKEIIDKEGLQEYIQFHPASSEIIKQYQKCEVFCLPSLYEGFPNVICEAMSCGKPILCSDVCDNAYIVEEGVNGMLFNPNDIHNMADTIVRYTQLPREKKEKMSIASREKAVRLFGSEVFCQKYVELIEGC